MSKPKKPGTDLAALKARLAKKTKGADAPDVPPPGQVAAPEVPPPGQQVPPPGQVAAPEVPPPGQQVPPPGQQLADVPPPGQQVPPPGHQMVDVPPPGQQYEPPPPQPAAQPQYEAPAPTQTEDNPFGSGMGGFDPDAGLIDSGPEIKARGGKGIVLFAAIIAAGIGGVAGWLVNTITSKQALIDQGMVKGAKMVEQVNKVSEARKGVSIELEDLKADIVKEGPKASADKITALMSETFDKQPQMSELFGWQLASVDPNGVKAVFKLYDEFAQLEENMSLMANVLTTHGENMAIGAPGLYGVTFGPNGATLIAIDDSLCGEPPAEGAEFDPSTLKPCGADSGQAIAYKVRGQEAPVMRGYGEGQAVVLLPEGGVYEFAIGIEPKNNATNFYKIALSRVEASLAEMDKAEEKALLALKKYAENPNVDGPQDGGGGEGEG